MISVNKLTFCYSGAQKPALKDINMVIEDGDFIGITGTSGAGKSSFTYALSGVVPHYFKGDFYGEVIVDGKDTVETAPEKLSEIIGSVFQDIDSQMVASEVEDEILFGLENFGVPHDEIGQRLSQALEMVGITSLRHRGINSLSGGQKQKVAIAAIIALRPKYIVLDEPTGELDPQSSRQIFRILKELNENFGITVIIVEQKIMLLCEYVHKLAVFENGEISIFGKVSDVLQNSSEHMRNIGINIPRIVSLQQELSKRGIYDGKPPLCLEQAKEMIEVAENDKA